MCDMYGVVLLLKAMIEISRGAQNPSIMPIWKRELLCARCPPKVTFTHHEYDEEVHVKRNCNNMAQGGFFFGPEEIEAIRCNHLPSNLQQSFSTFELLCACVWRCRALALQPNPEDIIRLTCTFNVRGRNVISLPLEYYGNTIVFPGVVTKAKDLICNKSLAYAVQLVKRAKGIVSEEYVRSMTDLMVRKGRPKFSEFLNWIPSNTMRSMLEDVDFGWGTPLYSGVARAISNMSNFTRFKNGREENVISVGLCLPLDAMLRFQKEMGRMIGKQTYTRSHLLQPTYYVRSKV